jgi:hypothetical protein
MESSGLLRSSRDALFRRIHKTRQSTKRSHKKITKDLWNTRREIQTQTKLDQPSWKKGQQQTAETRPQLQTSREKRSWTSLEKIATHHCRNRSTDLIYEDDGYYYYYFVGETWTIELIRRPRRRWEVQGNHKEITLDGAQRIRLDKRRSFYERQWTFGSDNVRGIKTCWEATGRLKKTLLNGVKCIEALPTLWNGQVAVFTITSKLVNNQWHPQPPQSRLKGLQPKWSSHSDVLTLYIPRIVLVLPFNPFQPVMPWDTILLIVLHMLPLRGREGLTLSIRKMLQFLGGLERVNPF